MKLRIPATRGRREQLIFSKARLDEFPVVSVQHTKILHYIYDICFVGIDLFPRELRKLAALYKDAWDSDHRCGVVRAFCLAARPDVILSIDARRHRRRLILTIRISYIIHVGHQFLKTIATVQVYIRISVPDEGIEQHMRQSVGCSPVLIAGEHPVEVLPVLVHHTHSPVLKAGPVGKRNDYQSSGKLPWVDLGRKLYRCLDAHELSVVDARGHKQNRPRSLTGDDGVRHLYRGAVDVYVIFDDPSRG